MPGSPQEKSDGGYPYIDNNETPGCDLDGINCYPLRWKTAAEIYEEQGVSWQVYQDADNFDDNPLAWFAQFQDAVNTSHLSQRGFQGLPLHVFYEQAANGTLPEVSYIVGPRELSEHPPFSPRDGAWLQKQIVDAVIHSPAYPHTALIISWDETGGFGDHVAPFHSPEGTPGEWLPDPYAGQGTVFSGPGFRLPFYIVSPWTRGGTVFTEHADHNSQILFVEKWQAVKGRDVRTDQMVPWRRSHMSDLTAAFDFAHPDYSLPVLPDAPPPHTDNKGAYDGSAFCAATYSVQRPPVPYSNISGAALDVRGLAEDGFKEMRGNLTEGRYVVFEAGGSALTHVGDMAGTTEAGEKHDNKAQRWVAHAVEIGGDQFRIASALDGTWLVADGSLTPDISKAEAFAVLFATSRGYALRRVNGKWLAPGQKGEVDWSHDPAYWKAFSVTYHD